MKKQTKKALKTEIVNFTNYLGFLITFLDILLVVGAAVCLLTHSETTIMSRDHGLLASITNKSP